MSRREGEASATSVIVPRHDDARLMEALEAL